MNEITNTGIIKMPERAYVHTFAELVDRLSIVLMKSIFISENRDAYRREMMLIEYDLDKLAEDQLQIVNFGKFIRAILAIQLANRWIWENEAGVREDGGGIEKLRWTHAVNGVRNTAKNIIAHRLGERPDKKIDCLAADLPAEMGNWNIFEDMQ
jgi:hypothetical protein